MLTFVETDQDGNKTFNTEKIYQEFISSEDFEAIREDALSQYDDDSIEAAYEMMQELYSWLSDFDEITERDLELIEEKHDEELFEQMHAGIT